MAESSVPAPTRRAALAGAGAACALAVAGCARYGGDLAGPPPAPPSTPVQVGSPAQAGSPVQVASPAPASASSSSGAPAGNGGPAQNRAPTQNGAPGPGGRPTTPAVTGPVLASTGDIPVGGGKILAAQRIVITQPQAGSFDAFTAVCTHLGCTVSTVSGGTINCPCHGSKFSIKDGSVVNGPASSPLAPVSIKVEGSSIVQA
jgi:Rieske Fe-S protein